MTVKLTSSAQQNFDEKKHASYMHGHMDLVSKQQDSFFDGSLYIERPIRLEQFRRRAKEMSTLFVVKER